MLSIQNSVFSPVIKQQEIIVEALDQSQKSFQADLAEIFKINQQVGWGHYNHGSMKRRAYKDPCPYLVAKIEGVVAGYIISEGEDLDDGAYVPFVATNPDFQRMGVAKSLMLKAIENAKEEGFTGMIFEYRGNKEHLKKFYESTIPAHAGCAVTTSDNGCYMNGDPKIGVNYEL